MMYLNDILPLFDLRITVYRDKAMVNIRIVNGWVDQKFQFIKAGPRPSCLHARCRQVNQLETLLITLYTMMGY